MLRTGAHLEHKNLARVEPVLFEQTLERRSRHRLPTTTTAVRRKRRVAPHDAGKLPVHDGDATAR
eukprot:2097424-Prymnesium_polylepis.1